MKETDVAKLNITQSHSVSSEEAKKQLDNWKTKLCDQYGLTSKWVSEKKATVERSGVKGTIEIKPTEIVVELDLSFAMTPLKGTIEKRIKEELAAQFA